MNALEAAIYEQHIDVAKVLLDHIVKSQIPMELPPIPLLFHELIARDSYCTLFVRTAGEMFPREPYCEILHALDVSHVYEIQCGI